jgi:hypothetical protein
MSWGIQMPFYTFRTPAVAAALAFSTTAALADAKDFRFDLVSDSHNVGSGAIVEVSLTDLRTNMAVEGAVIFAIRLDMAPDGMEMMTTSVAEAPADQPGHYRFASDLSMAGNWRLSLAAKVQGEMETVSTEIEFAVAP